VEEKILRLAFARDESESTIRERFDSTGHSIASWLVERNPTTFLLALVAKSTIA
jgi:hypothetical protein